MEHRLAKPAVEPKCAFWKRERFSLYQLRKMYSIYRVYYENTNFDLFMSDFNKKTGAFVITHPDTREIVGFSTLMDCKVNDGEKSYQAIFSGDTVIEKEFWGSRALQGAMFKYLIKAKLRYPTQPIYWLLISKGFKTYLLLANNYFTYYPHPEGKHQHLAPIVEAYCKQYFNDYYDPQNSLLNFGEGYQALKAAVAPITGDMRENNPKIRFFEQCNPSWEMGTELPCIGEIAWSDIARYVKRFATKPVSQGRMDALMAKNRGVPA